MIFQWESESATAYLKQLFSDETISRIKEKNPDFSYMDLFSIGNGAIRPAGESYRDKLSHGIYQIYDNDALNEFMKSTLGFCVEENQLVSTVDDGDVRIASIQVGDKVYTMDGVSTVTDKKFMGKKHTIKVSTQCSELICTDDHKIMSERGWIEAGKLKIGDCIAIKVGGNTENKEESYKLRLLGYLMGDGILTGANNVGFVNRDINVINDFCDCITHFENCTTSVNNRRSRVNKLDLYYVNVKHIAHKKRPTTVAKYLMDIGFKREGGGKSAKEKYIPEFIFELNKECMLDFLGAYTDTDCCIKNGNHKIVAYKTSSEKLSVDLVRLIRRIGYVAKKYFDEKTSSYTIVVSNAVELLKDMYEYSFKIRRIYSIKDLQLIKVKTDSLINVEVVNDVLEQNNICRKKIQRLTGTNLYNKALKHVSRDTLEKINDTCGGIMPEYLLKKNIKWLPVTNIEDSGYQKVYDITVENEHNFVCSGIVVHNCVFQEQIINFLHLFCGYTMGQADIVRRGFAKKTGTEKFIPDIKNGFAKYMHDNFGLSREESEKTITSFIQVIEDASDYLFSKNHADPYSWIGYICGYLRYYYPLEFITVALNIFESKEDKSIAIINYAKKRGIKISPVKFRHSIAEYSCDKETNEIFKGLSSIKFMNATVANELYELRNNRYESFIDLLIDMRNKTSINSRQITILIKLEFFSEFGAINNLLETQRVFSEFYGKKQFNKEKIISFGMHEDIIRKYSGNETEKMFTQVDAVGWLREECGNLNVKPTGIYDVAKYQLECLGYIDYTNENASGIAMVTDVDTKYSPRLAMYSLKNGNTVNCKIEKRKFSNCKLKKGDIVKIISTSYKHKKKKVEGEWIETNELELWINSYKIIA